MSEICPICNSPIAAGAQSCPACGFNLIGSTQRMQPISFDKKDSVRFEPRKIQEASLVIVRGEQINRAYTLEDRLMTVGRAPKNDIFLNDMTVSSQHAEIFTRGGEYIIRDTGSFNGVWINNENVTEAPLHDGDIVQIGTFCLLFEQ